MMRPMQVLSDCPACHVESAIVELVLPDQAAVGSCRMCGLALEGGAVVGPGAPFSSESEVVDAITRWAVAEGEEPQVFVEANFGAGSLHAVAALVLAGARVETSFDVVAWLFRTRTAGAMALGGRAQPSEQAEAFASAGSGGGGASPPATPPAGRATEDGPRSAEAAPPNLLATTRALVATALADGRVEAAERKVLASACTRLGAPQPTEADWRAWRPHEVGVPPDPVETVKAMIAVALADRVPDIGEARLIREFARSWRVPLREPVLPPVTPVQKATAAWLGLFAR